MQWFASRGRLFYLICRRPSPGIPVPPAIAPTGRRRMQWCITRGRLFYLGFRCQSPSIPVPSALAGDRPEYPRTSSDRAGWKDTNDGVHHRRQALLSRFQVPVPEYPRTSSARAKDDAPKLGASRSSVR